MAKGKTRKARAGAAPGAPKPTIPVPKTPMLQRRSVRWGALGLLVVLAAVLTPLLMGRANRANVLREYDRVLEQAQRPFTQHQAPSVPESFINVPTQFRQGTITPSALGDSVGTWVEDFNEAATNVGALTPPDELREAQGIIVRALEAYAGIAEQYGVLAEQARLVQGASGPRREELQGIVDDWLAQVDQEKIRVDGLYGFGTGLVQELKVAWGVSPPAPEQQIPDVGDLEGLIPDGGAPHGG